MTESKITSKGQITLPKAIREHLNVHPGDRVLFRIGEDGSVIVEPKIDLRTLLGIIDSGDVHLSLEDLQQIIATRSP